MSQVCTKCAHVNPPEAIYCYFDGVTLGGRAANGRPVQAGSQPFPSQFVFPSGQTCRNFDQFAVACQENWASAVDLLKQGFLASFLGGIGRSDLAMAAKEAARFPDNDRGLDRLLAKLPSQVLAAPKLRAEPTEVNLGVIQFGVNRSFELHLSNLGMRLLYGSVSSDCKWLTLGDAPGNRQKIFQFGGDAVVHVQIRGQHLRAGNKLLEGHLLVESNGGTATITVRADVPPKPYPNGVFAGAVTPRQIAEKALALPKDAAPLFESGAVARWFGENGWTYPVRGPSAVGVGGVQQFFEALGLAKAPKVEISHTMLALRGNVGQSVQATLELKTQEKRPVYGHAVCDQPWLDVSQSILSGRNAVIQVLVPRVPNRSGETLTANVNITSNGNQKFKVTVSLEISGEAPSSFPLSPGEKGAWESNVIPLAPLDSQPIAMVQAMPLPATGALPYIPLRGRSAVAEEEIPFADAIEVEPPRTSRSAASSVPVAPFVPVTNAPQRRDEPEMLPSPIRLLMHTIPAGLLAFFLLLVCGYDIILAPAMPDDTIPVDPSPRLGVYFDEGNPYNSMRFGLVAVPAKNQPETNLTYSKNGQTNSTVVKIGGQTRLFGFSIPGDGGADESRWVNKAEAIKSKWLKKDDKTVTGMKSVWQYTDRSRSGVKVQITQLVEIVAGEPIELKSGNLKRYLDTCRVRYVLENVGQEDTKVGLRIMIDTLIGVDASNDGVPFTVPGMKGLVNTSANFQTPKDRIPDFLQVLERPNLKDPGIVGFINLKLGGDAEPPSRVQLTHWSKMLDTWDIPQKPFLDDPREPPDSAVVLTWAEKTLTKSAKRELGFSYGLGSLSIAGGQLGISVGGNFVPNGDLTVVALVNNPEKGQKLTLKLKDGLRLADGEPETQAVPMAQAGDTQQSPVTWRIRADREGTFDIEVMSSTGISQKKRLTIKAKTVF